MPLFRQPQVIQTQYSALAVDTSTTSTSFVDLMSLTLATDSNRTITYFSAAGNNATSATALRFQLLIDGVVTRGCNTRCVSSGNGGTVSLVYYSSVLTPGSHTFKIQWSVSAGTGTINASTGTSDNAVLLVEEVNR
jgi:hypothetical protein